MDGWLKNFLSVHNPFLLSTVLCTTWLNPKALALLPGFCITVPLLPVLKTWLPQGLA
jgi:hypothetical protein